MRFFDLFLLKATLFASALLLLQIVFAPKANLLFIAILVFASLLTARETIVLAILAAAFNAALLYSSSYHWLYLVFALAATTINPKQIPDKFIVTLLYAIFFTALYEAFNPNSSAYFDRLVEILPMTAVVAAAMYFVVLLLFKDYVPKRVKFYD